VKILARILLGVSALIAFSIASMELGATIKFTDLFYLSSEATVGNAALPAILSNYARYSEQIYDGKLCRSDIVEAGLEVALADLDHQNADRNFEAWLTSVQRAEKLVLHALKCGPNVSDYWTRLAMIKLAGGENSAELAYVLGHAVALDPTNIAALRARFSVWRKLSGESLIAAKPSLESDLKVLLTYAGPRELRDIFPMTSANMQPYVIDVFNRLPEERKAQLTRWRALPVDKWNSENAVKGGKSDRNPFDARFMAERNEPKK
jgi:hypothetical protein